MTSEEAQQQAQAEGLTLLVGKSKAGYFGVRLDNPGQPSKPRRPGQPRVSHPQHVPSSF